MVLPLELLHARAFDVEDRHPPAVHAADLDLAQLAAAQEAHGPQEEILGLEHHRLPRRDQQALLRTIDRFLESFRAS